jgi:DNA-binding transcriptional ArsR family regulator
VPSAGAPPITDAFGAIAHPVRRTLVTALANGDKAVNELAAVVPVSRPAVSQHLKVLRDVGLVRDRAQGTRRIYEVDRAGLLVLRSYLDQLWSQSLDAFQATVEEQEQ